MTGPSEPVLLVPQAEGIPVLPPTPLTEPFWDGCSSRELRFQRCGTCGAAVFNPAHRCRQCTSDELRWEVSAGLGTVFSYTICHRPMTPEFTEVYAPVIVDMDEGYQILSNLIGCTSDDARVGMRVKVSFHPVGARTLPYFEPA